MDTIIIHPESKEQAKLFEQLAKALKVPFEKKKQSKKDAENDYHAYGEGFKKSVEEGLEAYKNGDMSQFSEIKREDLWK